VKGKLAILIMILFTVIALAIAWFLMQHIVEEYDLGSASGNDLSGFSPSSSAALEIYNPYFSGS
jgi:hypothetical protein